MKVVQKYHLVECQCLKTVANKTNITTNNLEAATVKVTFKAL